MTARLTGGRAVCAPQKRPITFVRNKGSFKFRPTYLILFFEVPEKLFSHFFSLLNVSDPHRFACLSSWPTITALVAQTDFISLVLDNETKTVGIGFLNWRDSFNCADRNKLLWRRTFEHFLPGRLFSWPKTVHLLQSYYLRFLHFYTQNFSRSVLCRFFSSPKYLPYLLSAQKF